MTGMARLVVVGAVAAVVLAAGAQAAAAASPFQWRAIIEGPYGRPWDHGQRLRVLDFMAREGLNAYVHAPKDDLYQRTQWRERYPADQQVEFDREIAYARGKGIEWVANLSPGLPLIPTPRPPAGAPSRDICYSCPSELDALMAKLEPFWQAGARTFMLSFDDVQKGLTHPEDVAAYGQGDEAYGKANGDLLTRFARTLRDRDPAARLLTVGADYSGTADTAYLQGLRATLAPEVEVMWTGPGVFSVNFTPDQARAYARTIGRKPVVWDNWTVNDADGNIFGATRRIHLGPYQRKPDIASEVRGFFLNPMNEADLNLLPFATAADYFEAPGSYDPRASFARRVAQAGGPARDELRAFAEVNWSSHFDLADEAPTFTALRDALLGAYENGGDWPAPRDSLAAELALLERARSTLAARPQLRFFVEQADPFLASAARGAAAAAAGTDLLAAERPLLELTATAAGFAGRAAPPDPARAAEARSRFADREGAVRADQRDTFGYRGAVFDVPPVQAPPNKLDAFLSRVRSLDADWQPRSGQAASRVEVRLDGSPVTLGPDGRFALPPAAAGRRLEATDGAGGRSALRVGVQAATAPVGCADRAAPVSRVERRRSRVRRTGVSLRGRASDAGCATAAARRRGRVRRVEVAVARVERHRRCRFLGAKGRLGRPRSCARPVLLRARGATRWRLAVRGALPAGRYLAAVRALDAAGNRERRATRANRWRARLR